MAFKSTKYNDFKNFNPGSKSGGSEFFKAPFPPSEGSNDYRLRILPPREESPTDFPIIAAPVHYWAGFKQSRPKGVTPGVSCNVLPGEPEDLATKIYFALRKFFPDKSPEQAAVNNLAPQTRYYVGVLHLATNKQAIPVDAQTPQIFSMTYGAWMGFKDKWDKWADEFESPLDDLSENGHDVILSSVTGPPNKYSWEVDPKPRAVEYDLDELAEKAVNLEEAVFGKGNSKVLSQEQCSAWVRPVLGEFFDPIISAYMGETGDSDFDIPELEIDDTELGEAI